MADTASIAAAVDTWVTQHHDEVIEWRRHLHSHPELSNEEVQTTRFIHDGLVAHGLQPVPFPGTGLYVDIGPEGGERLAFRADIDALMSPNRPASRSPPLSRGSPTRAATMSTPPLRWRSHVRLPKPPCPTAYASSSNRPKRSWAAARST